MGYPADCKYTKEHEWVRAQGTTFQVGITAFAVEQLGDVTMVELPEVGDTIEREQVFGTVESVKAVSDLFAPISGTITKSNTGLDDTPEAVNDAPYQAGWLVELSSSDPSELESLMDASEYAAFCAEDD